MATKRGAQRGGTPDCQRNWTPGRPPAEATTRVAAVRETKRPGPTDRKSFVACDVRLERGCRHPPPLLFSATLIRMAHPVLSSCPCNRTTAVDRQQTVGLLF